MRAIRIFVFLILCACASVCIADEMKTDAYGGDAGVTLNATGYFRTENINGRWRLVTPDGHPFYSIGVCSVGPHGDNAPALGYAPYEKNVLEKHGTVEKWADVTKKRLNEWGFNTRGAWSGDDVGGPWFAIVYFAGEVWQKGGMPDVFSDKFVQQAEIIASKEARQNDKLMIGYFLDNEMQWDTDWRNGPSLFDFYMTQEKDAAGKRALVDFLKTRYENTKKLSEVWHPEFADWDAVASASDIKSAPGADARARDDRDAFTYLAARQYFKTATDALRRHDPNHLIACNRFVSWTVPAAVILAAGEYCDIVSVNHYEVGPVGKALLESRPKNVSVPGAADPSFDVFYRLARRPMLISEFGFRADDSGLPNTYPPGRVVQPTVPTQKARAERYDKYVRTWAGTNYFVGNHWFKYMDEPAEGRFDGENGNYGLVNIKDEPYSEFVNAISVTNGEAIRLHEGDGKLKENPIFLYMAANDVFDSDGCMKFITEESYDLCTVVEGLYSVAEKRNGSLVVYAEIVHAQNKFEDGGDLYLNMVRPNAKYFNDFVNELSKIAASDAPFFGTGKTGMNFKVSESEGITAYEIRLWP